MVTELSAFSWKGHSSNLVEVCLGRRIRHHNASNLSLWKYLKIDSTLEEAFTEDLDKSRYVRTWHSRNHEFYKLPYLIFQLVRPWAHFSVSWVRETDLRD